MSQSETVSKAVVETVESWYESKRNKKGDVNFNVMAVGLAISNFIRQNFPITEQDITADNGAQVKGLNKQKTRGNRFSAPARSWFGWIWGC